MIEVEFKNIATKVIIQNSYYKKYDKEEQTVTLDYSDFRDIIETIFRYGVFVERTGCLPNEFIFDGPVR